MNALLEVVIPVFIIIALGYIIGKYKKINTQIFVDLIVYISAPFLIITSMSESAIDFSDFAVLFGAALSVILALMLLTYIYLKIKKSDQVGLYLPVTIGNTSYMGYPIALFAFGVVGLGRAIVYDMMNALFIFSIGIYIINRKQGIKEVLKVPLLYSVIIGILLNLLKISLPEFIFKPMNMIGMITIPLSLLILGYKLTEIKISNCKTAVIISFFRIVGGFLIALAITSLFNIQGISKHIILLQASMPAAVMSMILTAKYKKDAACAASVVLITTLASLATIPLILWFLSIY